jgi:hypothetical protein
MAIAFDAASGNYNGGSLATATAAHTCTGSNLGMVIGVACAEVPSSVTYNGIGATLIGHRNDGVTEMSIWYLDGPAAGTHNIVATVSTSQDINMVGASYSGVSGTAQPDANVLGGTVFVSSWTQALTTITDNSWTVMVADLHTGGTGVASGTGATLRWTSAGATGGRTGILDSAALIHPASTYSMTATGGDGTSFWGGGVLALAPFSGGGGGANHNALTLLGVG